MILARDGLVKYTAVSDPPKQLNITTVGITMAFRIYFQLLSSASAKIRKYRYMKTVSSIIP